MRWLPSILALVTIATLYRHALAVQPPPDVSGAAAAVRRGFALSELGEWDKAIKEFNDAIALDPRCHQAYLGRGNARANKNDIAGATSDIDEGLRIAPQNPSLLISRGTLWAKKGEMDKALSCFDRVLQIDPANAIAHNNRASVFLERKDWDRAIKNYDAAMSLLPPNLVVASLNSRAYALRNIGNADRALADYNESLRRDPAQPATLLVS